MIPKKWPRNWKQYFLMCSRVFHLTKKLRNPSHQNRNDFASEAKRSSNTLWVHKIFIKTKKISLGTFLSGFFLCECSVQSLLIQVLTKRFCNSLCIKLNRPIFFTYWLVTDKSSVHTIHSINKKCQLRWFVFSLSLYTKKRKRKPFTRLSKGKKRLYEYNV